MLHRSSRQRLTNRLFSLTTVCGLSVKRGCLLVFAVQEIFFRDISSIEYKDAGRVSLGHILILYRAGSDVKTSVFGDNSIASNENAVMFIIDDQPAFDTLRTMINDRMEQYHKPQQVQIQSAPSNLDELKKLAELRDAGVVTPEEFEREKARLLASH